MPEKSWISSLLWATPSETKDLAKCPVTGNIASNESEKCPVSGNISTKDAEKCPVDPKDRAKWMQNMKSVDIEEPVAAKPPSQCSSEGLDTINETSSSVDLPIERQVSSIPRTGAEEHWVYPSQKQFFDAMKRKKWDPEPSDMRTVVPIHNLVNERVWQLIQIWEKDQGGDQCGGVKLTSFKGESKNLTPRARMKVLMGYEKPFDRHDWVVNRCGKEIEYVIDFYRGKSEKKEPSFFIDVRPKLNSFEGWRMRFWKAVGY